MRLRNAAGEPQRDGFFCAPFFDTTPVRAFVAQTREDSRIGLR